MVILRLSAEPTKAATTMKGMRIALSTMLLLTGTSLIAQAYEIWVTNQRTNAVQVIDLPAKKVITILKLGGDPYGIAIKN